MEPNLNIIAAASEAACDRTAYLLIGHGTRNLAGQHQFLEVYRQFAELMLPALTGCAFLELAEPDIDQAIARLADQGARRIVTVPVLLFAAGHALQDIPQAVASAAAANSVEFVGQTAPLELSAPIVELSALRFRQGVCQKHHIACCLNTCSGQHCPQIALAMIGRGSRSEAAAEQMRQFSRLRWQQTPVAELFTAFVYAQSPTVPEVLQLLAGSPCATIVVQPHLLFEGELVVQLREQVAAAAAQNPEKQWLVTPTLGTDFALAETLAHLAREREKCI
jgi:sirohydrochlorin cobaltochelatase